MELKTIIKIIIGIIIFAMVFYGLSKLQMRAWLHEIDLFLGKKFVEHINKKEKENGTKEKE